MKLDLLKLLTEDGMVDICGGVMSGKDAQDELRNYLTRNPVELVLHLKQEAGKYRAVLYIDEKTFQGGSV